MEPTERNRRAWDDRHRGGAAERPGLPQAVRDRLPDIAGKRVLHLGSATGEASAELKALGALVTGVESSPQALASARELEPAVAWVQTEPDALPTELRRGRFDLAYSAEGVLAGVGSLAAWAGGITAALRPGGELLVHDEHPVSACLDQFLHWRESYFEDGFWGVGQIVGALAEAGFAVRRLEELPGHRPRDARVPGELLIIATKGE